MESKNSPEERRNFLASELLRVEADWVIISHPKHIFYLTGFPSNLNAWYSLMKGPRSTSFMALRSDGRCALLLGRSELENPFTGERTDAVRGLGDVTEYEDYSLKGEMVAYGDRVAAEMKRWLGGLDRHRFRKVAIEEWHLAEVYRDALHALHPDARVVGISKFLVEMRMSKGDDEVEKLEKATEMLDHSYSVARENSTPGKSELDVYGAINEDVFHRYGPFAWVVGDHASGERSLGVGGVPTHRKLKRGDTFILDLQVAHDNYWSDMCRTFVVGRKPSREQRSALAVVREAMEQSEKLLYPGTKGKEVYASVSRALADHGYSDLPHHAGHAIGLDDQERPWFIPAEERKLEEGSVCVVEPGIYRKDTGGIRIEDVFVVTAKGPRKLSHFPLKLG